MSDFGKYRILAFLASFALIASACGTPAARDAEISTAVAQTVQAGESLTEIASLPTATSQVTLQAETPAPDVTPTSAPTLASAPPDPNCAKAVLVDENPPDQVLLEPGQYYWKTWRLRNTGTCTWNPSYNLIFWSGDLMGGLVSYPLNDEVPPDQEKDISIYLRAPEADGTFTGYWRLQTPWNSNFGVGPGSSSFYVQVVVSSDKKPKYGITGVSYNLKRDPPTGCPTNVRYTVHATITTNGPFEFEFFWNQSDGNESGVREMEFTEAGSRTISREWMIGKGDSPNPRWMEIVVVRPFYHEYGKVTILNNCP